MAAARPQQQLAQGSGPRPRILRIGIILGGNIIEERLVRRRETVSVGQSAKNSFSIPVEGLPKTWPLFSLENGRYVLQFTGGMDGRVSAGGSVHPLDQLKSHGAQRRGNHWALPLDERSRGKIVVGEMTLLFQFVTAPPLQPRPQLPASVRGGLADRIEPQLAIIMALSIIAHFAVALYAYQRDRVVETRAEKLHREFVEDEFKDRVIADTFEMPEVETEGEVETDEAGTETETEEPEPTRPQPREPVETGGGDDDGGGDDGTPDEAAVQETIRQSALVAAITGGEGSGESRYSKMSDTDQGASLDKSIENAKGKEVSSRGNPGERKARGPNTGEIGTDKGTKVGGPGPGEKVAAKKEETVSRVNLGGVDDLSFTDLDPDQVARLIRSRYLAGIKQCHNAVLKKDPSAQGRVTIRFTVGPTGRVTKASVNGFNPDVDKCIQSQASRWRFGAPKDDGKPTSADFQIPLILKPGS